MKSKPIKLTPTSYALLALLDRFGELTSYEIKDALETSVENFWPVPHTTAYQEPPRLRAHRRGPRGAPCLGRRANRSAAAAARRAAAENLRRRRPRAVGRRAP